MYLNRMGMYHEAKKLGKKICQSLIRLREEDHVAFRKALENDDLSMQKFHSLCVDSYLQSDPDMLLLISRWKEKLYEERKSIKGNLGLITDKDKDKIYDEIASTPENSGDSED